MPQSYALVQLRSSDGSWQALVGAWTAECLAFDEEFEQYASASIPVLETLAGTDERHAGVFALADETGRYHAVLQANSTFLPGYDGKVLRVRHLLASPAYDFGEFSISEYSGILSKVLARVVSLSETGYPSPHIKMHLRSPADVSFFENVGDFLGNSGLFTSVKIRGAWLYLTKSPDLTSVIDSKEADNEAG